MERLSYIFIMAGAALWGIIGIFTKELSNMGLSTLQIVTIRAMVATIALFLYLLLKDKQLLKIKPSHFTYFIGTGILSFAFFNICYFTAINMTSLSIAVILLYTAPIMVMIFSAILFKEKLTVRKIQALILTFTGCILITAFTKGTLGQDISILGVLVGLGAGLGYALYSIFGRYALLKYDSLTVTFYTFLFASMGLIPISNINNSISLLFNMEALYHVLALGILTTVLPFLLYTKGLYYLETSKASILATMEPVVATIVGITIFKEPISVFKIVGMSLVLFAVSMLVEKNTKGEKEGTNI